MNDIFPNGLSVEDALDLLGPVAVYLIGVAVYSFFIFKFYRFVASRDMFKMDLSKYDTPRFRRVWLFLHFWKYFILFPLFAFFWFAVLTAILAFLSQDQSFSEVLLVALATVGAIRAVAYYSEDLSRDLAKILPFAVLAIFLIDASFFKISDSLDVLKRADDHRETIFYYLIFLIILEFALRVALAIVTLFRSAKGGAGTRPAPAEAAEPSPPAEGPTSQEDTP